MRNSLVVAATLTAAPVHAQEAPGQSVPPQPEQPAPGEPKVDPAYGERPEPADPADGGAGYFAAPRGKDIVVKMHPDRSRQNVAGIAITAGAGLLFGGLGLYFHLESKSATEEVGAKKFTGVAWSDELQDTYDHANNSAVAAGVLYGLGGAALVGAAIAYMITEPEVETHVIHPHVAVGKGGAVIGGAWSF
jgi:hypothetical protein